jgi:hypothetical protein
VIQRNAAVLLVSVFLWTQSSAQSDLTEQGSVFGYRYGIGGGMGITAISMNDVVSYLNLLHVPDRYNRISEFSSAVEFFGSFDLFLSPNIATGIEYSYLLGSHNISTGFGTDDFSFSYHMPLILGHYVVNGANYFFKFGGGLGYLFARYREDLGTLPEALIYSGGGIGGKAQAVGHTPFGDNLFAYIGIEMRFGFPGSVVDEDGRPLTDGRDNVSLNFFSFGLKFGLMYYF